MRNPPTEGSCARLKVDAATADLRFVRPEERNALTRPPGRAVRPERPPPERAELEPRRVVEPLTAREIEVLGLIGDGLFNREIAERLSLAEETVKSQVHHLLAKLGARSRAHAVAIGLRSGLID